MDFNGRHQLLVDNDVNLLVENIITINKTQKFYWTLLRKWIYK
jgi:hypothetical protein